MKPSSPGMVATTDEDVVLGWLRTLGRLKSGKSPAVAAHLPLLRRNDGAIFEGEKGTFLCILTNCSFLAERTRLQVTAEDKVL